MKTNKQTVVWVLGVLMARWWLSHGARAISVATAWEYMRSHTRTHTRTHMQTCMCTKDITRPLKTYVCNYISGMCVYT